MAHLASSYEMVVVGNPSSWGVVTMEADQEEEGEAVHLFLLSHHHNSPFHLDTLGNTCTEECKQSVSQQ